MTSDFKDMLDRFAKPGRLEEIWLRPARLEPPVEVREAWVTPTGLEGDHGRSGKRAVTLFQDEHLPVISAFLGQGTISPGVLRRNLVISGLNLSALRERQFALGGAVLEITVVCAPCSRMEEALGRGGYAALRGHGGWCASVVRPGKIAIGDAVRPLERVITDQD